MANKKKQASLKNRTAVAGKATSNSAKAPATTSNSAKAPATTSSAKAPAITSSAAASGSVSVAPLNGKKKAKEEVTKERTAVSQAKQRRKKFAWTDALTVKLIEARLAHKSEFEGVKATTPGFQKILDDILHDHPDVDLDVSQLQSKWKLLRKDVTTYNDAKRMTGSENVDNTKPKYYDLIVSALGKDNPVVRGPEVHVESFRPAGQTVADDFLDARVEKDSRSVTPEDFEDEGATEDDRTSEEDDSEDSSAETSSESEHTSKGPVHPRCFTTEVDNEESPKRQPKRNQAATPATKNKGKAKPSNRERSEKNLTAAKRRCLEKAQTLSQMKDDFQSNRAATQQFLQETAARDQEKVNSLKAFANAFTGFVGMFANQMAAGQSTALFAPPGALATPTPNRPATEVLGNNGTMSGVPNGPSDCFQFP